MAQSSLIAFDDNTSFADWLEEFEYFDSSCAGNFEPIPHSLSGLAASPASIELTPPERVTFQLGLPVGGSYDAGQLRRLRRFEFTAYGVELWTYTQEQPAVFGFDGPLLDGLIVNDENILLDLVINDSIQLQCRRIEVREIEDLTVVNRPFFGMHSATIFFHNTPLPKPSDWIEWLKGVGAEASWRRMHDVAVSAAEVNQENYEGWFLQSNSLIESTNTGIMLKSLKAVDDGFFAEVENWGEPDGTISSILWLKLSEVAANKTSVFVRFGNCLLTGSEWNQILQGRQELITSIDFAERSGAGLGGWYQGWGDPEQRLPSRLVTPAGWAANYGPWPYVSFNKENQMQWHWKDDSNGP